MFLDSSSAKIVNLSDIISPDTLSNLWINCLMLDHNRSLWIGTKNGINIYDRVSKKIKLFDPPDKNFAAINKDAVCILEDHSGRIWIGSPNNGIYRYDPSTGNSKIYRHSASDKNSLPSDEVTSLMEDSHHTIWIGTNEGVSVYQPGSDNFETYLNDANDKNSLNWKQVANLFEDQSGVLWIGMSSTGIRGYYPTEKKFILYPYRDKDQASHSPTGIHKDRSGNIYMTTFGSGVQEFNPVTEKFKSYMSFPEGKLTALNYYFGAFESSDGTLWLLGIHEGLHQLDRKIGKITTIYSKHGDVSTCMAEDLDKRLWIGANGGLKCYDLKTKKYSTAQELYPSTPELEFAHSFGDLYCDKNGILWIGGNSGLVILNTKTGKAKSFVQDPENLNSISSNGIYCFYDDENGHIWIGTSWGLNRFDKKTEQFVWYTVKDGLPDNNVVSILADESGHLWLSTEKGICQFTPPSSDKKVVCRNYDRSDGLPVKGLVVP
jgi:ligand-binding sensor domain-containing protein